MLEYFTIKKVKKHQAQRAESKRRDEEANKKLDEISASSAAAQATTPKPSPTIINQPANPDTARGARLLYNEDEEFLRRLTSSSGTTTPGADASDDKLNRPSLPPRPSTINVNWDSDGSSISDGKDGKKETATKSRDVTPSEDKPSRLSYITNIPRSISVRVKNRGKDASSSKDKGTAPKTDSLAVPVPAKEADREEAEVSKVLDDLNLAMSSDNKVFSLSKDSAEVVHKFTQILKDLVNGVPTAYGDLVKLIEDRDKVISQNFDKLPNGLKKLVTNLPDQLSAKLAPEVLAIAAEAQGLQKGAAGETIKGAAKQFANPKNLYDLVTKPGAVVGLLKGIVNALKVRWPAFMGTSVLWSVAVFLLLSVLWYCYRRGREERLLREAGGGDPIDGATRIEELPDDPTLPAPGGVTGAEATARKTIAESTPSTAEEAYTARSSDGRK